MQKLHEIEIDMPRDLFPEADDFDGPRCRERSDFESLLEELAEIIESEGGILTP